MGDAFYGANQQQPRDNLIENIFGLTQQTIHQQNQSQRGSLFSSPCIWNTTLATTQQDRSTTFTPSSSTKTWCSTDEDIVSILSPHIERQNSRNLLMTNIPQNYFAFLHETIKDHLQHYIYDIFSKHDLGTTTMVVLFYGIDQAKQCHAQLTNLLDNTKEFHLVELNFCSSATVSSLFGIELSSLQNTHLSVSLYGALSDLGSINYKEILGSFGELHQLTKLEHSGIKLTLLVEYKDTRNAVVAKETLHDKTEQGIVFSAYLTKLEVEQNNARNIQRPLGQLRSMFGDLSLRQVASPSRRTFGPHLTSQYSMFGRIDRQESISSLSSRQVQHTTTPSTFLLTSPLLPSSLHGNHQKQHSTLGVPPPHFALRPKNNNVSPLMAWPFFNSSMVPHHHPLQQQSGIPDFGMSLQLATTHYPNNNIGAQQNENMDLKHGFSTVSPTAINHHHSIPLKSTGLHTPISYSSESDTTTETDAHCYFGPVATKTSSVSLSSLTNKDRCAPTSSSSQPVDKDITIPNETTETRGCYRFDVDKVIKGEDSRTTFMIRNIPNKYTQAMLMECIDATHAKTYDFLYLRMDFKNKCNVGYAFINFIDVNSVISFAERKDGKHWNQFNSDKKCEISYAKIQGKANLIEKFRNSIVMEQEASYRPKIFYSSGPRQGEEQEFPSPTTTFTAKNRTGH